MDVENAAKVVGYKAYGMAVNVGYPRYTYYHHYATIYIKSSR